ncbi:MAG: hypothetical protein AAF432_14310 [Planctomycetota bacterium]
MANTKRPIPLIAQFIISAVLGCFLSTLIMVHYCARGWEGIVETTDVPDDVRDAMLDAWDKDASPSMVSSHYMRVGWDWYNVVQVADDPQDETHQLMRVDGGWPMRMARGEAKVATTQTTPSTWTGRGLYRFSTGTRPRRYWQYASNSAIPLRPIWSGLLINTALYGAAIWIIWFQLLIVRRARRTRAGKCAICRYPTAIGERCAECGTLQDGRSIQWKSKRALAS